MSTKNLKPFDLQEALSGKAVMLRCGWKAYVRYHETELNVSETGRLIGFTGEGTFISWCKNGQYLMPEKQHSHDIIGMWLETRIINGFEVPAPETEALDVGSKYFIASTIHKNFFTVDTWHDGEFDKLSLERGLIFLCKEDAIVTAKAMMGICPYDEENGL